MNTQIQIHFPSPGAWGRFNLTSLHTDAEGYNCRDTYNQTTLPDEYKEVFANIVTPLVALDEPWQATHVVATIAEQVVEPEVEESIEESAVEESSESDIAQPLTEESSEEESSEDPELIEVIRLIVNARRKTDNATRQFTYAEYPQLQFTDPVIIHAYKVLTHMPVSDTETAE